MDPGPSHSNKKIEEPNFYPTYTLSLLPQPQQYLLPAPQPNEETLMEQQQPQPYQFVQPLQQQQQQPHYAQQQQQPHYAQQQQQLLFPAPKRVIVESLRNADQLERHQQLLRFQQMKEQHIQRTQELEIIVQQYEAAQQLHPEPSQEAVAVVGAQPYQMQQYQQVQQHPQQRQQQQQFPQQSQQQLPQQSQQQLPQQPFQQQFVLQQPHGKQEIPLFPSLPFFLQTQKHRPPPSPAHLGHAYRAPIWRGMVAWNIVEPNNSKISVNISCSVFANKIGGEPEIRGDDWPNQAFILILPKDMLKIVEPYTKLCKTILFEVEPSHAASWLYNVMYTNNYYAILHFKDNRKCDLKLMILLYMGQTIRYIGVLPVDQEAFVEQVKRVAHLCGGWGGT